MSRTNKILAAVLVIQLVLLGVQAAWPDSANGQVSPGGALVANFDSAKVSQITIADNSDKQITLKKSGDVWTLPDYGDYPVTASTVTLLLTKIGQLRADRLITQSSTSFRSLQVSPDDFVRQVTFNQDDATHTLYVGKTGGGNTVHVRLEGQNQVYLTSNLTSQDASALSSSWIDTAYFSAAVDDVVSMRLQNANGEFDFTKSGDAWTVSGLGEGEMLNQDNLTSLLNTLTTLRMTEPVGKEAQDSFGLDAPQAIITLTVMETAAPAAPTPAVPDTSNLLGATPENTATVAPTATPQNVAKVYTFQIGAALDNGIVIKGSNSDYYVLISQTNADRFTTKTQADFTTVAPTATPEPPTETPLPMSVPPTAEPTAVPTTEPLTPQPQVSPTVEATVSPEAPTETPAPG